MIEASGLFWMDLPIVCERKLFCSDMFYVHVYTGIAGETVVVASPVGPLVRPFFS